ncbi:MAG TPA: DUF502 domain-containing protein [Bacteroides sp.]|nr:DUF502 domain-containing protein [Bacteroides sp.]
MIRYINTTLLGGVAAILPLALVLMVFRWVITVIGKYLRPIVDFFTMHLNIDSRWIELSIYLIVLAAILMAFFFIGIIIQTRIGTFFKKAFEKKYLMKIPGYKIARETVMQFFGKSKSFFKEVVLVDLFNSGTLMTGFITDNQGEFITVFVPTGPNPTSGNIYHVRKKNVYKTTAAVDDGMRSIISCGAGSGEVFQNIQEPGPDMGKLKT